MEESREEVVAAIIDGMVSQMTFEEMRTQVWDMLYDDLIWQEWPDLVMYAEEFATECLEE
jgi:hypothetical protein